MSWISVSFIADFAMKHACFMVSRYETFTPDSTMEYYHISYNELRTS